LRTLWIWFEPPLTRKKLQASDENKDEFYQQLSDLLSSVPAGHDIALLGDFNARIGADPDS